MPIALIQMPTLLLVDFGFDIMSLLRGLLGLAVLVGIGVLFSDNRKHINWSIIVMGIFLQVVLAIGILKVAFVERIFEGISAGFVKVISFTDFGTDFLFSSFVSGNAEAAIISFAFRILPTIVFFSALTSLLYYIGVLQKVVYVFAWVMKKTMKLSGAESLVAAGNIFLGQTESPFLVRPYLAGMTRSELMCMMTSGMATIAGGVLAAYIGFLGGDDPVQRLLFAKHLLAASVMSAPAAIVAAKLLVPEREKYNEEMKVNKEKMGANVLEAIANGTTDGVKLAVNVGAMLLVFTSFVYMGNWIMRDLIGEWTGANAFIVANTGFDGLSFQFIIGYAFAPIAWLMGVAKEDIFLVGQLLGEKTILNEFYAYKTLGEMKVANLFTHEKSIIMATYILCGFSNFASIGIQIGGIGSLIPDKKGVMSKLGMRALLGGTLACLLTAVVVGIFLK
jgi:CNT family concentrative nucleoside transporter